MKSNVIDYLSGSFVDYAGITHNVVVAAVSVPMTNDEFDYKVSKLLDEDWIDDIATLTKALHIGIAVCNPEDTFNEETGKNKAVGRALGTAPVLFTSASGMINTPVVKALLQQELDFVCSNPDTIIPGYSESKARYEKKQEVNKQIAALDDKQKTVLDFLTSGDNGNIAALNELATYINRRK